MRIAVLIAVAMAGLACGPPGQSVSSRGQAGMPPPREATPPTFTTAHRTVADAARDFFGIRRDAQQPIPFPHNVHIANKLTCTDYCHEAVTKGPRAGLPGVKTCMICHESVATDRPTVQQVADYQNRGVDISWQRVYGYAPEAHVRFNHAPHIRAKVECATCHGNVAQQTVAERVVDLNMGFCVNCHRTKQASNDCLTCHF
ncbi:MAG: cytochrome c3 family protein [Acidobacteria bacterium]|nr:cytochrome c3 family protein [Acidobacteriota bacterium]